MRKIIAFALPLLLCASAGIAQTNNAKSGASYLSLGPVLSLGHSWVSGLPNADARFKLSPAVGFGLVYSRHEHWGFGGQLLVSQEGFKDDFHFVSDQTTLYSTSPVYVRLPLRAIYFFGKYGDRVRPKLYLGPSIGVKVGETSYQTGYTIASENPALPHGFNTFDLGLNAGAGVNLRLNRATWLNLDLGYYHGLTDAVDYAGPDVFNGNRNLRLSAGIMWGL